MKYSGKILEGVGGRYSVRIHTPDTPLTGRVIPCLPKGAFRHAGITPLPGDNVTVELPEVGIATDAETRSRKDSAVISEILPAKNRLIRPPMANLDYLFAVFASALPDPIPETVDKLTAIAEFHKIKPIIVITKAELNPTLAASLAATYRLSSYPVFVLSAKTGEGIAEFRAFVRETLPGTTSAFAGASGIGKSTLLNTLFPHLELSTSEISSKVERGRHTTRKVSLFPIALGDTEDAREAYLADTPGFSMLDFVHFDFFDKEDLPFTFPEFAHHLGTCRYTRCTHTKEEGCSILEAVQRGEIAESRHASYVALYDILKNKHKWDKPEENGRKHKR